MKRAIILIILGAAIGGGGVWMKMHGTAASSAPAEAPPPEEDKTTITHDTNGNAVINMGDEMQGDAGIQVANPSAAQFSPEHKGYGRAQDPAALAALVSELNTELAAYAASSNELVRQQTLAVQGNASARTLQAAEAAAIHDQLAVQSTRDRLTLSWSRAVAERNDLPSLVQSLASGEAALIRIDLPSGDAPSSPPTGARIVSLSGASTNADFLGAVAAVDPQTQGRGYLFWLKPDSLQIAPGEAVTAYLKLPGEPMPGIIIPRAAVVRTEGRGWVYVLNSGGAAFTRTAIDLDHSVEDGWFVAKGLTPANYIVVVGAQTLLSEELKASLSGD